MTKSSKGRVERRLERKIKKIFEEALPIDHPELYANSKMASEMEKALKEGKITLEEDGKIHLKYVNKNDLGYVDKL
jgi:hypothetical protein